MFSKAPIIANNFKLADKVIQNKTVEVIETREKMSFPPKSRAIAIFWTTTCGPCKLEMMRLKNSVKAGKISKDQIFAINPFEAENTTRIFLKKENFPFTFINDPDTAFEVEVKATPTVLFLDNGKIKSASTGISLTGIYSAENFLKGHSK